MPGCKEEKKVSLDGPKTQENEHFEEVILTRAEYKPKRDFADWLNIGASSFEPHFLITLK